MTTSVKLILPEKKYIMWKKCSCASGWIRMPQLLDELHIMLINGINIIYLSEWIKFNFD